MREILFNHFKGKYQKDTWQEQKEKDIKVHANGEYPSHLLEERRPAESETIKKYRKKIWQPITAEPVNKVIGSLEKIRKSDDYAVIYPEEVPKTIKDGESLKDYMETKYPVFKSYTNYIFSYAFREYCLDAGAVLIIKPIQDTKSNEIPKPCAFLYNSHNIVEQTDSYCIILSDQVHTYESKGKIKEGVIYYYIDTETIETYVEEEKELTLVHEWVHGLGFMPLVQLYGQVIDYKNGRIKACSRLQPMVARLNEAAREYSDLQAEVVQHVHTTRWYYGAQECNKCLGTGAIPQTKGAPLECKSCKGKGTFPINPYEDYVLRMNQAGEAAVPTPPGGVFDKNTEIVKIQDERVDSHIYKALSSINHEYLNKTPLEESGVAKIVDRTELQNFVYSVAEDIIRIMDESYFIHNEIRYRFLVKNEKERLMMLPSIPVPAKYDIITESEYVANYDMAKKAGLTPEIIVQYEIEVINKKFAYNPKVRDKMILGLELDKLAGISEDVILDRLTNGVIQEVDYVIHANIMSLIDEAMLDDSFITLTKQDQYGRLKELAESIRPNRATEQ